MKNINLKAVKGYYSYNHKTQTITAEINGNDYELKATKHEIADHSCPEYSSRNRNIQTWADDFSNGEHKTKSVVIELEDYEFSKEELQEYFIANKHKAKDLVIL